MNIKVLVVILACFLLSAGFLCLPAGRASAQVDPLLKITSVQKNIFLGTSLLVKGTSSQNSTISVSIANENNLFSYSVKTNSNAQGNWSANLDQSLKSGNYYVEAVEYNDYETKIGSAKYGPIKIEGSFAILTGIFSFLVIILLAGFVGGWYINKLAEIKRYRRILMSQRDIVSSYNVLKSDVGNAIKSLNGEKITAGKINEAKFLLARAGDNLEKMNKYVIKGINVISKYDIIKKIDNLLSFNKK